MICLKMVNNSEHGFFFSKMKISLKNDPKSFKSTLHSFPTMKHFQIHGEDVEIPYLSNGGYRIDGIFFN